MQRPVQQQGGDDCCVRPGPFVPGPVKNTGQSSGSMPAKRGVAHLGPQADFSRDYESPIEEDEDLLLSGGLTVTCFDGLRHGGLIPDVSIPRSRTARKRRKVSEGSARKILPLPLPPSPKMATSSLILRFLVTSMFRCPRDGPLLPLAHHRLNGRNGFYV